MEHGYGGRSGSMTVRTPCVEREKGPEHTETYEYYREPDSLKRKRDIVESCYLHYVHCRGSGSEIDSENAYQQQGGTAHEHERELHRRIFLAAAAPYAYEQIHRDKGHFVEHEHREEIQRYEEPEYSQTQKAEPHEKFLHIRFHLP